MTMAWVSGRAINCVGARAKVMAVHFAFIRSNHIFLYILPFSQINFVPSIAQVNQFNRYIKFDSCAYLTA